MSHRVFIYNKKAENVSFKRHSFRQLKWSVKGGSGESWPDWGLWCFDGFMSELKGKHKHIFNDQLAFLTQQTWISQHTSVIGLQWEMMMVLCTPVDVDIPLNIRLLSSCVYELLGAERVGGGVTVRCHSCQARDHCSRQSLNICKNETTGHFSVFWCFIFFAKLTRRWTQH